MRRDDALAVLRSLEHELRAQGIAHLYLFGSVARDDAIAASDVDVAFDLIPDAEFDGFDQGRIFMDLADALGSPVDFVERRAFSSRFAQEVEGNLIQVF